MPIYNEDPTRTAAGCSDGRSPAQDRCNSAVFEIVVLSDSTNADAWINETIISVAKLRASLSAIMRFGIGALALQYRPQIRQHRGLRHALGRPLRSHDRARRGQLDRCTDVEAAGASHAGRSKVGDFANRAATHRRENFFLARLQQFAACVYGR